MSADHTTARPVDLTGVPAVAWPRVLAEVHWSLPVGAEVRIRAPQAERLADVVTGAGFSRSSPARTTRLRSLPDTVAPEMRLLVCGLNPSVYAADAGIGYARPGNRFWPAALDAGIVSRDRDPRHALDAHGVGMTDLVKRATRSAAEITTAEYATGLARIERLAAWLEPGTVCFVGLAGWRAVVDRRARAGRQGARLGGVPVYVMPSTSGANASSSRADLADHLRAAAASGELT